MKLGTYDIPDQRLIPTVFNTLEEISKVKRRERIKSKDLAIFLGFKHGTEPHYYRKLHSLLQYGLLEGKGIFQISELGEKILHPRSEQDKAIALTKSVLGVPLWNEIYQKHGKKPREDNFWAVLLDIAKVDPETAKSNATKILGWYLADIGHVSDEFSEFKEILDSSTETLRDNPTQDRHMSQQMVISKTSSLGQLSVPTMGTIEINDIDTLSIARSYLNVLEKKIKEKQTESTTNKTIEEDD